jgi:hypothetical protein
LKAKRNIFAKGAGHTPWKRSSLICLTGLGKNSAFWGVDVRF